MAERYQSGKKKRKVAKGQEKEQKKKKKNNKAEGLKEKKMKAQSA